MLNVLYRIHRTPGWEHFQSSLMIFSNTFDANGKFHWQVRCRIATTNIFRKLRGRLILHRWYFTGNYQQTLLLGKMLWYDKSMGPFKTCVTQEREEKRLTKNVTKSDVGEGFAAKTCDATHSKKTRFREWRSFWMAPMMMFYFAIFLIVYLLMVSLDFYETNKPYISK